MLDDLPVRLWFDRWVGKSNCCIATATDFISETVKHVTQKHLTWNQARLPAKLKHIIERRKGNQTGFP